MAVKTRTPNRKNRIDPSLPKNPPTVSVTATIVAGKLTLTAGEPLVYNPKLLNPDDSDQLPGLTVTDSDGEHSATTVTLTGGGTIATIDETGGTLAATGTTVSLSPEMQALRSGRGGILALGQITF